MNYQQQATGFATKYCVKLQVLGCEYKPMWNEKQSRSVFKMRLKRNGKQYTFEFGQSIQAGNTEPALCVIFTCLTKSDPCSFDDFCADYGYDNDSKTAERTYKAVVKEYEAVDRLFSDVMDELQEIQ